MRYLSNSFLVFSILVSAALALSVPAALAAPPVITNTSFSGISETTATLRGSVDPAGTKTNAHFEYTTVAEFEANGFTGALSTPVISVPIQVKGTGAVTTGQATVKGVSTSAGSFGPGQTVSGENIPAETTIIEVTVDPTSNLAELTLSNAATASKAGEALSATGPQPLAAQIAGLTPATGYRLRLIAKNLTNQESIGPQATLYTFAPAPSYGACPNDAFRSGELAPLTHPGALLPDCRAYEQASPLAKNGNNALNLPTFTRAGINGGAITYGATFGIPGGSGAQALPYYLASRGAGESGWATSGLMPPATLGDTARNQIGWLPDFSATYAQAEKTGVGVALFELHADGSPPTQIAPYTPISASFAPFGYAGASDDSSTVVIEAKDALAAEEGQVPIAAAVPDAANVYAWDRATGRLQLASVMNDGTAPPKGAAAGPYDWVFKSLRSGGPSAGYYGVEEHTVADDGSVYFTSLGNGHLYQRLHPTQPQSAVIHPGEPNEQCTEAAKACTIYISATHKANGDGPGGTDPAGTQPAAFMEASTDGKRAFFTSSEKLTDNANTGPEQTPAAIGKADLVAPAPDTTRDDDYLPNHALGVAVDPAGEYIYWVDPRKATIGRAKLNENAPPGPPDDEFVIPGPTSFEPDPVHKHGFTEETPTVPRSLAVDGQYVYWTNRGPLNPDGKAKQHAGSVGRATIGDGISEEVRPEFIPDASNPQGIAVNSDYIYWANSPENTEFPSPPKSIARASLDGSEVNRTFHTLGNWLPQGVALSSSDIYFIIREQKNNYIDRIPLEGGTDDVNFITNTGPLAGIAVSNTQIYWASEGESAIGRMSIAAFSGGSCPSNPVCEKEFLNLSGAPFGLALGGNQLYYSVNGEAPSNPGNDLYRYEAGAPSPLKDLTPDPVGNGAEVQGLVGTSDDGSHVYFVANGDLDGSGPAEKGDCQSIPTVAVSTGRCNLYVAHEGTTTFIASVKPDSGDEADKEVAIWAQNSRLGTNRAAVPKGALVSSDGETLVFLSHEKLTEYENRGGAELYRYHLGDPEPLSCVSCDPTGALPTAGPTLGSNSFPQEPREEGISPTSARFLAANGRRVFFESQEGLVSADTNAEAGCPVTGNSQQRLPSCLDVYEWEAPATGTCTKGGPGYSPLNRGCIYLISTGKSKDPTLFGDASASGNDVYLFTSGGLVGQDTDGLIDVYDARVGGGLASQNPSPQPPCEGEACKPGTAQPPAFTAPPHFAGPANRKPKRCRTKKCRKQKEKKGHRHRRGQNHKHHHRGHK